MLRVELRYREENELHQGVVINPRPKKINNYLLSLHLICKSRKYSM